MEVAMIWDPTTHRFSSWWNEGLSPSHKGMDKMIGEPSAHWLSCAGTHSTGRLKEERIQFFQLTVLCHPVCSLPLWNSGGPEKTWQGHRRGWVTATASALVSLNTARKCRSNTNVSLSLIRWRDRSYSNDSLVNRISECFECKSPAKYHI